MYAPSKRKSEKKRRRLIIQNIYRYIHVFIVCLKFRNHCRVYFRNGGSRSELVIIRVQLTNSVCSYNPGPVTIVLAMGSAMTAKRQLKTENMDVSLNILNNLTIHEGFNTIIKRCSRQKFRPQNGS